MRLGDLSFFALAFALALVAAGCKHGSAKLEGRWRGMRAEGVTADVQAQADAFAVGTEIEVKGDSIAVITPAAKAKQTGKYKVVKEEKTVVVLYTEADGQTDPQTFTFVDEKTMKWTIVDGKTITFKKLELGEAGAPSK